MSSPRPSAVEERLALWAQKNPASPVRAVVDYAATLGYTVVAPDGEAKYLRLVLDAPAGRGATLYVDNFGLTAAGAATKELAAAMPGAVVRATDVRLPYDAADPMAVLDSFRRSVGGGPVDPPHQATAQYPVPPVGAGAHAVSATRRPPVVLAVVAAVVLLLVVGGAATGGFSGAMIMLGLAVLVVGLIGAVRGRAQWAFIASRRVGGIVAAAGLVALIVGTATAPPTAPTPTAAPPTPSAAVASPSLDTEAATVAAEAQLLVAETEETDTAASAVDVTTGLLGDSAAQTAVEDAQPTTALAALAAVPVKGRAPKTGYDRDQFGAAWTDVDRNGCDTRNDVLARDLTAEAFKPGTRDCVVVSGQLADPYSGKAISFLRGQDTSAAVQIDHVVALSNAWQTGAQGLDAARRTAFANDPLNLLAVDGPLNVQKGDGDAATWLPPNKSYRCAYVARQVAVKVSYGLWMTQAERNAIATVLATCPAEPLPGGVVATVAARTTAAPATTAAPTAAPAAPRTSTQPAPAPKPAPAPAPKPAPAPEPEPEPEPEPADVFYKNCDAVRAAGAAPIHPGDPGWQPKFDRDDDGVGCES